MFVGVASSFLFARQGRLPRHHDLVLPPTENESRTVARSDHTLIHQSMNGGQNLSAWWNQIARGDGFMQAIRRHFDSRMVQHAIKMTMSREAWDALAFTSKESALNSAEASPVYIFTSGLANAPVFGQPCRVIGVSKPIDIAMKTTCLLVAASVLLLAAAVAPAATAPSTNAPVKLDERDYYLEELKIAEELLQREEKQAEAGKSSPDRILNAKRTVLSLKRQIVACDERTKRPSPEQLAERQQRSEQQKRDAAGREERSAALKHELLPVLIEIARKDADNRVRQSSVSAISRLRMEESIEPLGQIVLNDLDLSVRSVALVAVAEFRNEQSLVMLLRLFDQLPDTETGLKRDILTRLQVQQKQYAAFNSFNWVNVVPTNVVPKLQDIVLTSAVRDLRRLALQQLGTVSGEGATAALIAIFEKSGDAETRQTIVAFLGSRADPQAMRKLVEIAKSDTDARSRQSAVELLGGLPFDNRSGPIYARRGPVPMAQPPSASIPVR
jgi:HEAT repeat protein